MNGEFLEVERPMRETLLSEPHKIRHHLSRTDLAQDRNGVRCHAPVLIL